jgi:hypothetical protein
MPCIGYGEAARTGEGYLSADANPSSGADFVHATFSHKGRREVKKPGTTTGYCRP